MEQKRRKGNTNRRTKPNKKASPAVAVLRGVGITFLSIILICIITCTIFITALTIYVMNFADSSSTVLLEDAEMNYATRFFAKNPNYTPGGDEDEWVLYYKIVPTGTTMKWTDFEDIPETLRDAYIYTEDERFYSHEGVDFKRTMASFANMFLHFYDSRQGGSTITQQTIKNITGDSDASGISGINRKIREIFTAIDMEQSYLKDDILECYLNIVPLGDGKYNIIGVQAAANYYFGKDVSELSLAECAALAGMTNSPTANNPSNEENNFKRRDYTLRHMRNNGAITPEEYDEAIAEKLNVTCDINYTSVDQFDSDEKAINEGVTTYFTDEAYKQAVNILSENYGVDADSAKEKLSSGGYNIYLTIDVDMQDKVDKKFKDPKTFQAYNLSQDDLLSAFICLDYQGNVQAVCGGRDEKTVSMGWNIATNSQRSPGSCIKPIASYAPAIDNDICTWSTLFKDEPIMIDENGDGTKDKKWPVNYSEVGGTSNWSYNYYPTWYMLMRSLNTCPAQLIDKMGPDTSYVFLQDKLKMTLSPLDADYSPMTVGGMTKGTYLDELVSAYQIFGNGGKFYDRTYISRITDYSGTSIYDHNYSYSQAIAENSAYVVNRMMYEVVNNDNGTGKEAKLSNVEVVGKTGTSQEWQNLQFVGLTPDYISGVWIGYDNLETIPTNKYNNIAKIWKNIFGDIAKNEENKEFQKPDSVVEAQYCTKSGQLATDKCQSKAKGYYKDSNVPGYCTSCG